MGTGATTARPTSIAVIRMLGSGATRTHPGQQVPWCLHRIPLSAPAPLSLLLTPSDCPLASWRRPYHWGLETWEEEVKCLPS